MYVATANIRSNPLMALWKVARDLHRILHRFRGGVVGLQEIRPAYRHVLRVVLRGHRWRGAWKGTRIPIVWDNRTHRLVGRGEKIRTHSGRARTSPARYLVWVILEERATGLRFVVVNTHMVSGAWNRKRKRHKAWRRQAWVDHWEAQDETVEELHATGLPVFAVGDLNRIKVRKFVAAQVEYVHGIDHLAMIPGTSARVRRVGRPVRLESREDGGPLWTDHAARGQEVRLERREVAARVGR